MYANLHDSLKKKGLSVNATALAIKMPESTFRKKLFEREFSIEEAYKIKDNLFPEMDMRFLFENSKSREKEW